MACPYLVILQQKILDDRYAVWYRNIKANISKFLERLFLHDV